MENNAADRELILTKTINAPVAIVWEAWANPAHNAEWWGPDGFTNTITLMDFTPGGQWNLIMHGPDGANYPNENVFKEITPLQKIVYDHVSAPVFTSTIIFKAQGEQTQIEWHMLFATAEEFTQIVKVYKVGEGLQQLIDKLALYAAAMV